MNKMKLSIQITLVFVFSFLLTSILLGVFITNKLDDVYVSNVFERLEAEGKALKQSSDINNFQQIEGIAYIQYLHKENQYYTSENINMFVDEETIRLLINKAVVQENTSSQYSNTINSEVFYYVILNYKGFSEIQSDEVFIVITDDRMKNEMVRDTTIQIVGISLIAFLLGYLMILLWVSKLVRDTKNISSILSKIGNKQYKGDIQTNRQDEIGKLVNSIEIMRQKIVENEQEKQEIIQGISHDLKTPIAVIQSHAEALNDQMCEASEVAEITIRECKRLNDKVTKLLHLSRLHYIDNNYKEISHTNMKELIEEIVYLYSYQTKSVIKVNGNESVFSGDKESWRIVIENLMDNAIRYSKSIIQITIGKDKFSIYNDGSHIKENDITAIFNAYEKSIDGKFGLGLSIVKRTVVLFGYDVKVVNNHEGVTFAIEKE